MPKPIIDSNKCSKCGTCIDICPMEVFAKEKDAVVVKKAKECIGCRACEVQCEKEAIKVED
ncbi:4Fe-4S binding protein [Candidatus Woesearchaeota archaeon]|nr:4Fe-4S binding protein [Candidatus Woesearchaeota archaeon]